MGKLGKKAIKEAVEQHKEFIDEYFNNGFNKYRAAIKVNPTLSVHSANIWAQSILKSEKARSYLTEKQALLRAETQITTEKVLKELISFAYSDITDYIDLSKEDLKALPSELRRCIQSIEQVDKEWFNPVTKEKEKETTYKIKLVDKMKSLDMISKNIGFYEADNRQKVTQINLNKFDNATLNNILQVIGNQDNDDTRPIDAL